MSVKYSVGLNNSSKVHCTFMDASIAFDKVLLNCLFLKLLYFSSLYCVNAESTIYSDVKMNVWSYFTRSLEV